MLIQMAISRSREFAADASGAQIAGNPYGLADALRKIDAVSKRVPLDANPATAHMFIIKPFSGAGLMGLFSSHPPTEDRIRALLGGIPLGKTRPLLMNRRAGASALRSLWLPATSARFSFPLKQLAHTHPLALRAARELL